MSRVWSRRSVVSAGLVGIVLLVTLGQRLGWAQETTGPAVLENRCSGCHPPHEEGGRLASIESQRKTPEGWQMNIYRMVRSHGARLQPGEARTLIKYLSDHYGLAPSEVEPFRYALERRNNTIEQNVPKSVQGACASCHSYARIALQRRTPASWNELPDLTAALLPNIENQTASTGLLDDFWYEVVKKETVPYLTNAYPFVSEAWTQWRAAPKPNYAGVWNVVGHDPGQGGDYTGRMTVTADGDDSYSGDFSYTFADGSRLSGKTTAVVYTGFQWRGVAQVNGEKVGGETSDAEKTQREIFFANEDGTVIRGRRLLTDIGDLGMDETLYRNAGQARLLSVIPTALPTGKTHTLRLFGMNLPADLTAAALSLGQGVRIQSLSRPDADSLVVEARLDADAAVGRRQVSIQGVAGELPLTVYQTVDYIRLSPEQAFSRPGGIRTPKVLQQFEVFGYLNGPDGRKGTADDVRLDRVSPVRWKLEEYVKRINDDDVRFVGTVDEHGLFTPAQDGPNPQRRLSTGNVGDVWVEAWYQPEGAKRPLGARAHLLVMPAKFNFQPIE